ncbi:hypothetical protein AHAS_Ahas02G0142800 [Arachis hypogaea]
MGTKTKLFLLTMLITLSLSSVGMVQGSSRKLLAPTFPDFGSCDFPPFPDFE